MTCTGQHRVPNSRNLDLGVAGIRSLTAPVSTQPLPARMKIANAAIWLFEQKFLRLKRRMSDHARLYAC
jgi:hypothetical protein